MLLTKISGMTRKEHTREIPLTEEEFTAALIKWQGGALITDAFPTLSADDREFIMTGITPEEWNAAFPPQEDEPEDGKGEDAPPHADDK